MHAGVVRRNS